MQVVRVPYRYERWNAAVACAVSTAGAGLALSAFALTLGVLVRWVSHVTGVWPL